jgi:DNA repair exonuclease SbcCD nuclease subunit
MSSKKRSFEFTSNADGSSVASVRDRKFKKRFVADTAYPTYSYSTFLHNTIFSNDATLMSGFCSAPPIERFSKQDGEFAFTASGFKSNSDRVNVQYAYKYGDKWVGDFRDAETLRAQDVVKYDNYTETLDFSDVVPRGPVTWDDVDNLHKFISEIKAIRAHFNTDREVQTIPKPSWVDELNESHAEAKANQDAA